MQVADVSSVAGLIRLGVASVCAALLLVPSPSSAEDYVPDATFLASDGAANYNFGKAVAISGDIAVVGAANTAAYVYRFAGGSWNQEQKLTASDEVGGSRFGSAVAVSGDTIVVGAYGFVAGPYGTNYGAAYVYRHNGSSWVEQDKLTASDGTRDDYLGYSVAISGDVILLGAYGDAGTSVRFSGSAYVFRYDGIGSWTEEQRLSASDGAGNNFFGFSVALSGDVAAIGAYGDNDGGNYSGSAYVFRYNGVDTWIQEDILTASDGAALDEFGGAIAVEGDLVVVGLSHTLGPHIGAAYVYRYDGAGDWIEEIKLNSDSDTGGEAFGGSVAISDATVVVGASAKRLGTTTIFYAGAAYVFWYDGTSWVEEGELMDPAAELYDGLATSVAISGNIVLAGVPGDRENGNRSGSAQLLRLTPRPDKLIASDGAQYDLFGDAVAISGNTALVGAPDDDDAGTRSGSAYLFSLVGQNWTELDKLSASNAAANQHFGASVVLDGVTAMVGAPGQELLAGAAYVFRFNGATWNQDPLLIPNDSASEDQFGASVDVSGDTAVIGAPNNGSTEFENGAGAAYVFALNGSSWTQVVKLTASDGDVDDGFGASVAISGDTIAIGAEFDDDNGIDAGAAYVFRFNGSNWVEEDKLVAAGVEEDDAFGRSVACSADTIVVGTPRDDDNGSGAGAVYVFGYDGVNWVEEIKLDASDGATVDRFGDTVAISSQNTIVVGAEFDDMKGSAYVFWWDQSKWVEEPKLIAPDRGTDYFGASVAISGDTVLVGCPYNGIDDLGAGYVSTVGYVGAIPEPSLLALNWVAIVALAGVARLRSRDGEVES